MISVFLSNSLGFGNQSPLLGSLRTVALRRNSAPDSNASNSFLTENGDFLFHDTEVRDLNNDSIIQAIFAGSTSVSSEAISAPDNESVADFLQTKKHRDLLFPTAGCSDVKELGTPTEDQRVQIDSISREVFPLPDPTYQEVQCSILEIQSPAINFGGLRVNTVNTMASQLVFLCKQQQHEYRFWLLSSRIWAVGPTPMVWLFKKLTARDSSNEQMDGSNAHRKQTSFSFTRLWAERSRDDTSQIMFNIDASLEVRINIPKLMMRLLPMKIEKFERKGSAAIQQLLDKDLQQSVKRLEETYQKWIATNCSSAS